MLACAMETKAEMWDVAARNVQDVVFSFPFNLQRKYIWLLVISLKRAQCCFSRRCSLQTDAWKSRYLLCILNLSFVAFFCRLARQNEMEWNETYYCYTIIALFRPLSNWTTRTARFRNNPSKTQTHTSHTLHKWPRECASIAYLVRTWYI